MFFFFFSCIGILLTYICRCRNESNKTHYPSYTISFVVVCRHIATVLHNATGRTFFERWMKIVNDEWQKLGLNIILIGPNKFKIKNIANIQFLKISRWKVDVQWNSRRIRIRFQNPYRWIRTVRCKYETSILPDKWPIAIPLSYGPATIVHCGH